MAYLNISYVASSWSWPHHLDVSVQYDTQKRKNVAKSSDAFHDTKNKYLDIAQTFKTQLLVIAIVVTIVTNWL